MKKILTSLLFISFFFYVVKAQITEADLQGNWTLTSLQGGDTTRILTVDEMIQEGGKYRTDYPEQDTKLNISGSTYQYIYYPGGTRSFHGTTSLDGINYTLTGDPTGCGDCDPKVFYFLVRSVSANELVLDMYDEDWGKSTYKHFIFTK